MLGIFLLGGCMVGCINLEVTFKFIFLLFRWFLLPHCFVHIGIVKCDSIWGYRFQYLHNAIDWYEKK